MKSIDFVVHYSAEIEIRKILLTGFFICYKTASKTQRHAVSINVVINEIDPRNTHQKIFQTHEIPTRKILDPRIPTRKIADTRNAHEKENLNPRNTHEKNSRTHKIYPREKILDSRNTHEKKMLDPRNTHEGTMAKWH